MDITRTGILAIAIYFLAYDSAQAQEPCVCCDPCYSSPAVITTYYASPAATYPSGAVGWTRYRPLFGDYVTRIRYGGYSPVVYGPGWLW
jgi:hypothetical protein